MTNSQYRITTLWALAECTLGGVMHAFKLPFTGIFVGGFSVLCIGLLAASHPFRPKVILQSLVVVLVIKATVSPQSPPTAYIAVAFQGVAGASILCFLRPRLLASLLFGGICLFESAIQKVLTAWLFYGKALFDAFDAFFTEVLRIFGANSGISWSQWIVGTYICGYTLWGLFLGWVLYRFPIWSAQLAPDIAALTIRETGSIDQPVSRPKSRWVAWVGITLFIAIVLWMTGGKVDGTQRAVYAIVRTIMALALWFLLITPVFKVLINRWVARQTSKNAVFIREIVDQVPDFRLKTIHLYQAVARKNTGLRKWKIFIVALLTSHS